MRYASLCDGIGAVHCAWQPLGWECAWTSEIEKFPMAVVEARHPGISNLGDMLAITESMLDEHERPDLVVAGTPCQSFSVAGLRGGLDDPRGNLALRFIQLVGVLQPTWVVWENVPGVLSSNRGRDFGTILGALAQLGYGFAYRVLDAQYFGVPQRRRRVFVVGCSRGWQRAAAVLFERQGVRGNPPTREAARQGTAADAGRGAAGAFYESSGTRSPAHVIEGTPALKAGGHVAAHLPIDDAEGTRSCWWDGSQLSQTLDAVVAKGQTMPEKNRFPAVLVAHTSDGVVADPITTAEGKAWTNEGNTFRLRNCVQQGVDLYNQALTGDCHPPLRTAGGHGSPALMEHMDAQTMAVRRLTPLECERLQGFPDGWTQIPWRKKPAEECPDGPRYRALGNSMAVPVMRWIGERILVVDSIP